MLKRSGVWVRDEDVTRWRSKHAWLREGSVVAAPEREALPEWVAAIGVDWGVARLATTTNAAYELAHARYAQRAAARLARYQRRMARRRRVPGRRASRGYRRSRRVVARQHRRVVRQRFDAARKWARLVVRDHGVIAVEDFRPAFLAKSRMARAAADGSVGILKRALIEAAERGGRQVVLVDPKYTTMDCSACHARAKIP